MNNKEVRKKLLENLCNFVDRVSKGGENATPEESRVLPEVASLIIGMTSSPESYE